MPVAGSVKVTGLRELAKAFKDVDADLPKQLRLRYLDIATHVASVASSKVPRLTGKAAGSIKPRATQRGASVAFSDSDGKVPYYPWLDFGGKVGRQASIERSFIPKGRYIYPTIAEESGTIGSMTEQAVEDTAEDARFEVRG